MSDAPEKQLEGELWRCVEQCRAAGYNPGYFVQMIDERGALGACRKLINDNAPSAGFTKLWEMGRMDLTVEAVALGSPYSSLFSQGERLKARRRLEEYGHKP